MERAEAELFFCGVAGAEATAKSSLTPKAAKRVLVAVWLSDTHVLATFWYETVLEARYVFQALSDHGKVDTTSRMLKLRW